jgi:hypothetical protein
MAAANSSSYGLARLIASPVLDLHIFVSLCPSKFREASTLEHAFVCEDEMATLLDDAVDLLIQGHDLVLKLLEPHGLPLWGIENLDLLHLDPRLLHQLGQDVWSDPPVWELPVEEATSNMYPIWSLFL